MAATNQVLIGQYDGSSLLAVFSDNESQADLLQISSSNHGVNPPFNSDTWVSVDYTGAVHFNAAGLTPVNGGGGSGLYTVQGALVGRFGVSINSFLGSSTVAQAFALAFPYNTQNLDIIQIRNKGGNISYWLDSTGVAHGS